MAAQVLMNLGLSLEAIRTEVLNLLGPSIVSDNMEEPIPLADVPEPNLPDEVRLVLATFDQLLDQIGHFKQAAIAVQDFEKAGRIRNQQDRIAWTKAEFRRLCL